MWYDLPEHKQDFMIRELTRIAYQQANLDEVIESRDGFTVKLSRQAKWMAKGGPFWTHSPVKIWNTYAVCESKGDLIAALIELLGDFDVGNEDIYSCFPQREKVR
jgi:hypothetical protein